MILTANSYTGMAWEDHRKRVILPMLVKYGIREAGMGEGELLAEVNHGRWIIRCACGGAEKAWEEKIFMCQSCWNAPFKHQFMKSAFPKNRKKIEELLMKRPIPNRNWLVGETVEQLRQENEQHKEELL